MPCSPGVDCPGLQGGSMVLSSVMMDRVGQKDLHAGLGQSTPGSEENTWGHLVLCGAQQACAVMVSKCVV